MKRLKKIIGTVIFFAIGIVLFVAVSYMLRPVTNDFFRKQVTGFYAEEEDSLDIVTLGSSAIYRYFNNPYLWSEYGMTSYNLATPVQSIFFTEDLIDEVKKTQSPDLIVIEIRKFAGTKEVSRNSERFPLVYNNLKYSWNRIELINSTVDDWSERFNAYFDIVSYHDTWEDFSSENLKYIDNENKHELKGWKPVSEVEEIEEPVMLDGDEELAIPEVSEEALIGILEKCKEENIEVLFVATPWGISEQHQLKNRYMGKLIEEYGFNFLDCNLYQEEIGLDYEKDFYNNNHTNLDGSEKVTKFLGKYIQENYDINTEHSEKVTEEWDKALSKYIIEAAEAKAEIEATAAELKTGQKDTTDEDTTVAVSE